VRVLHSVCCFRAGWEPRHVNKLLLEVRLSEGSEMRVLLSGFVGCPARTRSPVQWSEGGGNPPGQEQSSLREV